MPTKVRLSGSTSRVLRLNSSSGPREVIVTFATGEDLPAGDLYATATSRDDEILLDVFDATGSDGVVTVVATVDPADLEEFGRRVWTVEVGTLDGGSGSGSEDDTAYVMFAGSVVFDQVTPKVIASTTIQEAAS